MPSLRNWINYLEAAVKCVFIKSTNYEAQKTKKFRDQIGRIENMKYDRDEDCFICAEGRKLRCHKESTQMQDGIPVTRYEIKKVSGGMFYTEFTISMRCDKIESQ